MTIPPPPSPSPTPPLSSPSPPLAPPQVLSTGLTPSQRYGSLGGFTGQRMIPPPSNITILCVSMAGGGKTALFASNPDAYIINIDLSSFSAFEPRAMFWPGLDPLGRGALDDKGQPFFLKATHIKERVELLKKMALSNAIRPKQIIFDTGTSLLRMLLADKLAAAGKATIREAHGPTFYDEVYSELTSYIVDLRAHGYGAVLNGHLSERDVRVGEDVVERQVRINMTDNLLGRMSDIWEALIVIEKRNKVVMVPDPRFPTLRNKDIRKDTPTSFLTFNHPHLVRHLKSRLRFDIPEFEIPLGSGWQTFEQQYFKAAQDTIDRPLPLPIVVS